MADNEMLDPATAAAIERVPGVERCGTRVGNWLMKDQANDLLNAPDPETLTGERDRAILAVLLGCCLRRAELLQITWKICNSGRDAGCFPTWRVRGGDSGP
jgi:integrase/recombinase XerD